MIEYRLTFWANVLYQVIHLVSGACYQEAMPALVIFALVYHYFFEED